jgi:hypothetical protein
MPVNIGGYIPMVFLRFRTRSKKRYPTLQTPAKEYQIFSPKKVYFFFSMHADRVPNCQRKEEKGCNLTQLPLAMAIENLLNMDNIPSY